MISRVILKQRTPYLPAKDRAEIESYLATVKARRAALDEVRKAAVPVVDRVIARMRAMYPQFAKFHQFGFEKGHRDLVLLTYMAGNAMFLGEHETLADMFTVWYKTILKSVHVNAQFMRDTMTLWLQELQSQLSDEAYALMRPHVEHLSETLSDLPVPVKDEVGERRINTEPLGAPSWKS